MSKSLCKWLSVAPEKITDFPLITWSHNALHFTQNALDLWVSTLYIYGLVQERRNSSALAMELRLSCSDPSISRLGNHTSQSKAMASYLTDSHAASRPGAV